ASRGYPVTPTIATLWRNAAALLSDQPGFADCFMPGGSQPKAGEIFRSAAMAASLQAIAETEGEAFYRGRLAGQLAWDAKRHGAALTEDDLAAHRADWCGTIAQDFAGSAVHEIPPNGQGIATLIALGILEAAGLGDAPVDSVETTHLCIEATKLGL